MRRVSAPRTARARVRAQLTSEIADVARTHLATDGAAALSLRAVARELGMASSAVYRYFPSRDDLLTTLIVDAYDALGEAAEHAEAGVARDDLRGRLHAACAAARDWALAHPHEYALLYGSPVPGYAAPETTIAPAGRVGLLITGIVRDGLASGALTPLPAGADTIDDRALADVGLTDDPARAALVVNAWSGLFGAIGFELHGHTHNIVTDHAAWFRGVVDTHADALGLP
ncbi:MULTISPECIES: TetR/AcrR family transcriptional regulator [unclassified Pseudonocardia]|uniref:TetR/AcrR family transcriptional regulator n=1 Tax=unclassified Pseudonocardia TaxID=2619320 RepID=UPI000ACAACE8|nr:MULTISPECIES: TetR/AcrR family transcriptional regulator [unclassified Pseudonocardia]